MAAPHTRYPDQDPFSWLDHPTGDIDSPYLIPIDDFVRGGHYVVRADLPGVDPERDIDIQVRDDLLTLVAHRHAERVSTRHREVPYGELSRTLRLPAGCQTAEITTRYHAGVLEVSVPLLDMSQRS